MNRYKAGEKMLTLARWWFLKKVSGGVIRLNMKDWNDHPCMIRLSCYYRNPAQCLHSSILIARASRILRQRGLADSFWHKYITQVKKIYSALTPRISGCISKKSIKWLSLSSENWFGNNLRTPMKSSGVGMFILYSMHESSCFSHWQNCWCEYSPPLC